MSTQPKKDPKIIKEIEDLKQKIDDLTNALQLERADAVNVRRRAEQDKIKMSSYFKSLVIKELIPFIDNFELADKHRPKTETDQKSGEGSPETKWIIGIHKTYEQLWQILNKLGVKKIETVGKDFNPELHEAVQVDPNSQGSKEVVVEEFRSGYVLEDEVIRHAMVKVAMK